MFQEKCKDLLLTVNNCFAFNGEFLVNEIRHTNPSVSTSNHRVDA